MANKRGDGAKHSKKQAEKIRKAKDDYRWADAADDANITIDEAKRTYRTAPYTSAADPMSADTERKKSNDLAAKQEKADIKNSGRLEVEGAPKPRKRFSKGGMCRGGGKATQGTKFAGVK